MRQRTDVLAENPLTSSRAVRLVLTKAANDTVGLALSVLGVSEEVNALDDMLGTLGDDLMLIELMGHGRLMVGLHLICKCALLCLKCRRWAR